jgi:hypothetical protein
MPSNALSRRGRVGRRPKVCKVNPLLRYLKLVVLEGNPNWGTRFKALAHNQALPQTHVFNVTIKHTGPDGTNSQNYQMQNRTWIEDSLPGGGAGDHVLTMKTLLDPPTEHKTLVVNYTMHLLLFA